MIEQSPFIPVKPPRHRRGRPPVVAPAAPAAPALTSATYDPGTSITLTFDRAINIDNLVGDQIVVEDYPGTEYKWIATGTATLLDPRTVQIGLVQEQPAGVEFTTLWATDTNGIAAAVGGLAWEGVTDLPLPFTA